MQKEQMDCSAVVVAPHGNPYLEQEIVQNGAYCMLKPFDMQYLKECICGMLKARLPKGPAGFRKARQNTAVTLEMMVTEVIFQVGVPAHIKGYAYLRKAIMLSVMEPEMINSVTKVLYPEVAKAFGTTPSRVERAIRHAIEIAWDRGDVEVLGAYFGYTINTGRGKPTNSEFIAMIADRLRLRADTQALLQQEVSL
jgi:two-component system response regulator (stage 0 sporulation protein A)